MNTTLPISLWEVAASAAAMLVPWAVSRRMGLGLGRDLVVGSIRVFVQLIAVGYALSYIFALNRPAPVLGILLLMTLMAGRHTCERAGTRESAVFVIAVGTIGLGTLALASFVFYAVIGVEPWYNPRYVIPLVGMGLTGAMNGVAVAIRDLDRGLRDGRERVEAALSFGATSWKAGAFAAEHAVKQAMVPTVNALMTAGIVQLPGFMTGQIIGGGDPVQAVRYQVVIFYLLTGIAATSTIAAVLILFRRRFTTAHQLRI